MATHDLPAGQLGEPPDDWFSLFQASEAMNWAIPPDRLATLPDAWAHWATVYQQAKHEAAVMRAQIDESRAKGQA